MQEIQKNTTMKLIKKINYETDSSRMVNR